MSLLYGLSYRLTDLFTVRLAAPKDAHRRTIMWGVVGILAGLVFLGRYLPNLPVQTMPVQLADWAFMVRAIQVMALGGWIAWRQPWRVATPSQQRQGRFIMIISAILLFPGVATLLLEPDPLVPLSYYLVLAVCLVQVFWLSRRGLVSLAAIVLTANLILQQVALSDLVRGPGTVGAPLVYGLIILVGSFTVAWWFGLLIALILPSAITALSVAGILATPLDWGTAVLYSMLLGT